MYFLLALLSLVAELVFGYPQSLVRAIGHPVMWIGKLVSLLDLMLNRDNDSDSQRRYAGVLALAVLLLAAVVPAQLVASILGLIPFGIVATAIVASSLLAQRSLAGRRGA
jgi:adenosylcobinamide-phosphate synthase